MCPQPKASFNEQGVDEDCFQCNVWVPVGRGPDGGESVSVYIYTDCMNYVLMGF